MSPPPFFFSRKFKNIHSSSVAFIPQLLKNNFASGNPSILSQILIRDIQDHRWGEATCPSATFPRYLHRAPRQQLQPKPKVTLCATMGCSGGHATAISSMCVFSETHPGNSSLPKSTPRLSFSPAQGTTPSLDTFSHQNPQDRKEAVLYWYPA